MQKVIWHRTLVRNILLMYSFQEPCVCSMLGPMVRQTNVNWKSDLSVFGMGYLLSYCANTHVHDKRKWSPQPFRWTKKKYFWKPKADDFRHIASEIDGHSKSHTFCFWEKKKRTEKHLRPIDNVCRMHIEMFDFFLNRFGRYNWIENLCLCVSNLPAFPYRALATTVAINNYISIRKSICTIHR